MMHEVNMMAAFSIACRRTQVSGGCGPLGEDRNVTARQKTCGCYLALFSMLRTIRAPQLCRKSD